MGWRVGAGPKLVCVTMLNIVLHLPKCGGTTFAANLKAHIGTRFFHYISRQDEEIAKIRRHEGMLLPDNLDYAVIDGLSNELKQKLLGVSSDTLAALAIPSERRGR